jgi:hypothetical protein
MWRERLLAEQDFSFGNGMAQNRILKAVVGGFRLVSPPGFYRSGGVDRLRNSSEKQRCWQSSRF